MMSLPNLIRLS
uniref:Nucleolar protein 14 isoform X2 n=1 Tax=Rhizophora mucronata TaxID=61149 RepID=A0A2P2LIA5_RHIMU